MIYIWSHCFPTSCICWILCLSFSCCFKKIVFLCIIVFPTLYYLFAYFINFIQKRNCTLLFCEFFPSILFLIVINGWAANLSCIAVRYPIMSCTTFHLPIPLSMEVWVILGSSPSKWSCCEHLWFLQGKQPGIKLLAHIILTSLGNLNNANSISMAVTDINLSTSYLYFSCPHSH